MPNIFSVLRNFFDFLGSHQKILNMMEVKKSTFHLRSLSFSMGRCADKYITSVCVAARPAHYIILSVNCAKCSDGIVSSNLKEGIH